MIQFLIIILLFWSLIHFFNFQLKKTTNNNFNKGINFDLRFLSFHLSTTNLNRLPTLLLKPFTPKRSKGFNSTGILRSFWDIGSFIVIFGILIAQLVLLWSSFKSLSALWTLLKSIGSNEVIETTKKLIKRIIESTPSAASNLVIRPVIPGLTLPLSTLPLLLLALLSSQAFHELGHGMAAASEYVPILSTGLHLYIILPTFYVSLPDTSPSKFSDLRIATAGVWHNLVLVLVVLGLSEKGIGIGKYFEKIGFKDVEGGLLVVSIDSSSPLSYHLSPYSLITHLNDLELDSSTNPLDLWSSYLSGILPPSSSYENLGWCLPLASFTTIPAECCLPPSSSSSSIDNSQLENPRLCFSIPSLSSPRESTTQSMSLKACLNPLPYFPPSKKIPPRCLDTSNCEELDVGCARPIDGEKVLRIGVSGEIGRSDESGERSRTIVWQGDWKGVLEQVSVSSVLPRYWFVPVWYPRTIERFYSHLVSLSLALAFFNLLPLPHLDGSHIVHSFFQCLSTFSDDINLEAGLHPSSNLSSTSGLLEKGFNRLSRLKSIRKLIFSSDKIERGLKIWTVGVAIVTLVVSLIVEVGSHHSSTSIG